MDTITFEKFPKISRLNREIVVTEKIDGTNAQVIVTYDGQILGSLAALGSVAAPGFMKPEGIVIFHTASNTLFKVTLEKDESPKGLANGKEN